MPRATKATLQPRKQPAQQRSSETVEAILQATIQVLVAVGKERLTTTRVAHRAGVSVGTLYQYFPNKSALLQATLRRHIQGVQTAVEHVCRLERSRPLPDMTTALVDAYLGAKMRNVKESAVLYSVSSDVDGMAIAQAAGKRVRHALAEMFATAPEGLTKEPELVASVVSAALNGISRRLLESKSPERHLPVLREELLTLLHAYLRTCVG
ncbi:TetR/AcrR family transcriptional regulator [Acidobacterium capsulatum]|uniref:Transcriptional regulatory protein n=1 Tax=Acidobacterium capsulatum (strain ATCC 51196 / DSM 11244 / BCRC 80197 / JCM 7670 / NBRC 15755 / NCIMB 13165 / 161) TaxID=240015 RepID=C1F3Y8_ACIC5|nr:TetR/AcrR family transcriptional regulator [Acidobacterium capsulatum]ACO31986.1 transcriptional regulatory protein [Acidobacterium capsulatum ATCC 51196]HCT61719.1 TetR/AcrR family transcriptional regulator [Acidobacterium sp.]